MSPHSFHSNLCAKNRFSEVFLKYGIHTLRISQQALWYDAQRPTQSHSVLQSPSGRLSSEAALGLPPPNPHLRRLITGHASLDSWTACFCLDKYIYCLECGINLQTVAPSSDTADASPTPAPPTLPQLPRLRPLPLDALRHRGGYEAPLNSRRPPRHVSS